MFPNLCLLHVTYCTRSLPSDSATHFILSHFVAGLLGPRMGLPLLVREVPGAPCASEIASARPERTGKPKQ